jgi:transcriptional antiterminator RfaH
MGYWAVARLQPRHERAGLINLGLQGYELYYPRVRERRMSHGRRIEVRPPLFWGYAFFVVENGQWYSARWSIGIMGVLMHGIKPARVADHIIDDLHKRERNGAIELPRRDGFKPGDQVRILQGPFTGHLALYAGMRPRQRVEILLQLLGGEQRVTLAKKDIEVVR